MSGEIGTSHSKSKVIGKSQDTAKAWVRFNGTSSTTDIKSSFNVSSVADGADGDYTMYFISPMMDTEYAAFVADNYTTGAPHAHTCEDHHQNHIRVRLAQFGTGNHTASIISVLVFSDTKQGI